jgi:hypothetical protein
MQNGNFDEAEKVCEEVCATAETRGFPTMIQRLIKRLGFPKGGGIQCTIMVLIGKSATYAIKRYCFSTSGHLLQERTKAIRAMW